MRKKLIAYLNNKKRISKNIWLFSFSSEEKIKKILPGQFLMIKIKKNYQLRHPFSVHKYENKEFELLVDNVGDFTQKLTLLQINNTIDFIGPLGNGFLPNKNKKLIVIGGGIGSAFLRNFCEFHNNIFFILGAKSKEDIYQCFPGNTLYITEDGSFGSKGLVTDYLERNINSDCEIFACGPEGMIKQITRICRKLKINANFSLEAFMGCGVGACAGCVTDILELNKKVCKDGPVFNIKDIIC